MTPDTIVEFSRNAMWLVLIMAAPVVLVAAVIGLIVGFIQAITSIQDQSISVALKLIAIGLVVAVASSWMGRELLAYSMRLFEQIGRI